MGKHDSTMTIEGPQDLLLSGIREFSRGNEGAALEAFACALSVDSVPGALCSARLRILHREHAAAQALLEKLIDREPELAEAYFLLGQVHQACCRLFEAIACFQRALALQPADRRAAAALSNLLDVQEP